MSLAVALAIAAVLLPQAKVNVRPGIYVPDLSRVADRSGALKVVFGRTRLCVQRDGTFHLAAIRFEGFWRMHQGRVVLTFNGFFDRPFPIPDAVLKRSWPTTNLEGYVLSVRKDGTLVLPAMGSAKGPVLFRREADRSTKELIATSNHYEPGTEDEKEAIGEAAYYALADRIPSRLREVLDVIEDPRVPIDERVWAGILLGERLSPKNAPELRKALESVLNEGLAPRAAGRIGRTLGSALAKIADRDSIPVMMKASETGRVFRSDVAEAIATAGFREGEPQLLGWLGDKSEYVRGETCTALAALGLDSALPKLRDISLNDPEGQVRIAAWAAVLKLSNDLSERERAIDALGELFDKTPFHNRDILQAWGASKSRRAMARLICVLEGEFNPRDRAEAATQLARQGFPEAVPALLSMKSRQPPGPPPNRPPTEREVLTRSFERAIEFWADNAIVMKAVVEALWAFDGRDRGED